METPLIGGRSDLPYREDLNIAALSRSLDETNTSYKFLWMLALLETVGEADDKDEVLKVSMRAVIVRMLKIARPIVCTYRLYLGRDDRMNKYIGWRDAAGCVVERVQIAEDRAFGMLRKYVPQQWLVPFIEKREPKLPKGSSARAKKILRLMSDPKAVRYLPYRLAKAGKDVEVEIDRKWRRYFKRHNEVVKGWTMYCFAEYVQARNPHTPGIVAKLAHPEQRTALTAERNWWKVMMAEMGGVRCIYSGQRLQPDGRFDLDHFVPWSFVGHNRIWNLVPVAPEANSAKSDNLPSKQRYLNLLIDQQQRALEACVGYKGRKGTGWGNILDAYVADLKIDVGPQAPPPEKIPRAFREVVPPLMKLAASRGFKTGWVYRPPKAA